VHILGIDMLQLKYSQRCGYFVLEVESKIAPSLYEISYDNLQFRVAKQRVGYNNKRWFVIWLKTMVKLS